jgi:transposase
MQAVVHAADVQDRDGGVLLMGALFGLYPFLLKLYVDSGYKSTKFQDGLQAVCREVNIEIIRRCDRHCFVVLPNRWIVERTIAWLNRCRRLAKDWECLNRTGLCFLRWAPVRLMLRRLCQISK